MTTNNGQGHIYPNTTDPNGYYTIMLPTGTYTVTASLAGYITQSQSANILAEQVTTLDFALQSICEPVSGIDFTWSPTALFNGELITFTATANGTHPIDFQWNFGDTFTNTGVTVTHAYIEAATYTVT
jgi:PKD repeat protein